jgi:type IV secretory pathway VirB10-like protein
MNTRILAVLLATGCVTAAAGGAYLAVRQNGDSARPAVTTATPTEPNAAPAPPAAKPVNETEAIVDTPAPPAARPEAAAKPEAAATKPDVKPSPPQEAPAATAPARTTPDSRPARAAGPEPSRGPRPEPSRGPDPSRAATPPPAAAPRVEPAPAPAHPAPPVNTAPAAETRAATPAPEASPERATESREPRAKQVQFDEVVLPASSVLGLQVETPLSSERTQIEDRVEARVTRDVTSEGHVAVPAGSKVLGSVTVVERGGKMKERARLGVRFHTLVLADGRQVPLRTETIIREGDSPSNESARKIGGAAVGGAILGAILGGGKGAMIGGAAGAGGGSAAVMAGDRNAATLPAGTVVSVRLSSPATIEVERAPQ